MLVIVLKERKKLKSLNRLDDFATEGQSLLSDYEVIEAHDYYESWVDDVSEYLKENFPGTGLTAEWISLGTSLIVTPEGYDDSPEMWFHFMKIVQSRIKWLSQVPRKINKRTSSRNENIQTYDKDKVFIVHGHNNEQKVSVTRFIEKLGLQAIILHEQANVGKTIIEKFEKYSKVGYAIVLLTADDKGCSKNDNTGKFNLRARQNVIFELVSCHL
jgi:CAP12/Pycsar effector protein, TIR domain